MLKGSEAASNEESYDAFPRIEEDFQSDLDKSLNPRGPESLFNVVDALGLKPGSRAIDVGCGEGQQAIELARRFEFDVLGIDPLPRHVELSQTAANEAKVTIRFQRGAAEAIPVADDEVDLLWCREVIGHVADLSKAFTEFRRVLRQEEGRAVIEATFATEKLDLANVVWPWRIDAYTAADAAAAIQASGLEVVDYVDVASEWGEYSQERRGEAGRRLTHIARMLRSSDRYIDRFGEANYKIMLGDCFWHVYRMIGVLGTGVFVLRKR